MHRINEFHINKVSCDLADAYYSSPSSQHAGSDLPLCENKEFPPSLPELRRQVAESRSYVRGVFPQ
jgi:hypothetical protein